MAYKRQLKAGVKVTYHGESGDQKARILSFDGMSRAELLLGDETLLLHVPEGRNPGEWTAIPPRRGT